MGFGSLVLLPLEIVFKKLWFRKIPKEDSQLGSRACLWALGNAGGMFPVLLGWEWFQHNNSHSFSCSALLPVLGLHSGVIKGILRERSIPNPPNYLLLQQQSAGKSPICGCGGVPEVFFQLGIVSGSAAMLLWFLSDLGRAAPLRLLLSEHRAWKWGFWIVPDTIQECVLGIIWGEFRKGRWGGTGVQPSMCPSPQLSWLSQSCWQDKDAKNEDLVS